MFQNIFPRRGPNLAALSLFTTKSIDNVRIFDDKQTISYPVCFSYLERLPPVSGRERLPKSTGTNGTIVPDTAAQLTGNGGVIC